MRENYVKTRSIFDLSNVSPGDYDECVLACMPRFAWEFARSLIYDYGWRRTSFSAENDTSGYDTPDDETYDQIQASLSSALGGCVMSCDEIVQAIEGISIAVTTQGGCGCQEGTGGSGSVETGPETFEDDGSTTFPPNYDDRQEYIDNKCGIARGIIEQMLVDLLWIEGGSLITLTVTIFLGALFTPIPGDEIIAFVAVCLTIFLQGVLVATIQAIITAINADIEALVCAVVEASTSAIAQDDFLSQLALTGVEAQIIAFLVTNDSFNGLFQFGPILTDFSPCNCDPCGSMCNYIIHNGIEDSGDLQTGGSYSSQWDGSFHSISITIQVDAPGDICTDRCNDTELVLNGSNLSGWTARGPGGSFQIDGVDDPELETGCSVNRYTADTLPEDIAGFFFYYGSETAFTIDIECAS